MSLDEEYGRCEAPGRDVNPHEHNYRPQSLQRLTEETAPILRSYLATAERGLAVPRILHRTTNLLWIVDGVGDLWFAIEEIVHQDSGELLYTYPRTRSLKPPPEHVKLGHPSLLSAIDKHARIGGEIQWVPRYNRWVLVNQSGRYGDRPWQTKNHLDAVARKFNQFGIDFHVVFWSPTNQKVGQ